MSKTLRVLSSFLVAAALTVPALAWAQAVPRGGGSSSSGSSGSSGGGSSSGGSSSGGSSSSDYSPPPPPPPPPPSQPARTPPPPRTPPPDKGSAASHGSGSGSGQSSGASSSTSGSAVRPGQDNNDNSTGAVFRSRNGRPAVGSAVPRSSLPQGGGGGSAPIDHWNTWYPWYGSGLNWGIGYAGYYDPYYVPYSRWSWGVYGSWYNPYGIYGPYGYLDPVYMDPWLVTSAYGYGGGGGGDSYSSESVPMHDVPSGSIRLRVKPGSGTVFLDGSKIGVVDDFDGLGHHLAATAGRHEIEIRADGYEPLKMIVEVEADRTITARGSATKKRQ